MVAVYLDASVVVPLLLDEAHTRTVTQWVAVNEAQMLLSDLAAAEVASAISLALRTGRESQAGATRRLEEFDDWRVTQTYGAEITADDIRAADSFVRRFDLKLRTPDAIHAATAHRIGATLITLDRRLLMAAAALGIAAASPIAAHT